MSRLFEMLNACDGCGTLSFGAVWLHWLMEDRRLRFCSGACKARWMDTRPSDFGDADPREVGR